MLFRSLTKTSAVFLLPGFGLAILLAVKSAPRLAARCAVVAAVSCVGTFCLWVLAIVRLGLFKNFRDFFSNYPIDRPKQVYVILHHLLGLFHTAWMTDHIVFPLAALAALAAIWAWRSSWGRLLLLDPVFGASAGTIAGSICFMVYDDYHPPRYFVVVLVFCILMLAKGAGVMLGHSVPPYDANSRRSPNRTTELDFTGSILPFFLGRAIIVICAVAVVLYGVRTTQFVAHPGFTFVKAASDLTRFIDEHPNGRRLLVSVSGDEIALVTHLSGLCAPYALGPCASNRETASTLAVYQPGWYAEWNSVNPTTLELLHTHFSVEQVAIFHAFDLPARNSLVLFKLHPLPSGQVRNSLTQNLQVPLGDDKIYVPIK